MGCLIWCAGAQEREYQGALRQPGADLHPHDLESAGRRLHPREDDPGKCMLSAFFLFCTWQGALVRSSNDSLHLPPW